MGVNITELLVKKEIEFDELTNKKIGVDAFNVLYQFLSTIRQRDGTLLTDSSGTVTSHLVGLFARTTNLMQKGLKLAFIFDGEAPKLKNAERERRNKLKNKAIELHKDAVDREDIDDMKKYAARTTKLSKEMVAEAKELISALGLPVIQAPSEGEAQVASMVIKNDLYALTSQDNDGLLFGCPRMVRNLTISQRKKMPGKMNFITVRPEQINLDENLKHLGITQDQLIVLGILIGTDFNNGGVKGIGPKNALKMVKKFGTDFNALFKEVKWEFDYPWENVFDLIKSIKTTADYDLKWSRPDKEKVYELLVETHGFEKGRVETTMDKFSGVEQKGLGDFF